MDRIASLELRVNSIDARLGRIEDDVSSIKSSLANLDAKMDIAGIRSDFEKAHTDIYKWIVTLIAVVGAIYFGIQKLPSPLSHPEPAHAPARGAPAEPAAAPR